MKQASHSGGITVTHSYDALDRRVQRSSTVSGAAKFVYDGVDVVRDLDVSGNTIADYLNALGTDNKLRQTVADSASYFLTDHLGTMHSLSDASGGIASDAGYDSFGNLTGGSAATRYTFTGREHDNDIGLMYYRARWYDTYGGRFVGEDPIGFEGGDINLYSYVSNNPLMWTDPSGTQIRSDRDRPGDKEWAEALRKQMASWPSQPADSDGCPCDPVETEKALKKIAHVIGARLGERWRIENLVNPYNKVLDDLKREGFEPFFNPNPPHWGGSDFQGQVNNRWYHVTVYYPYRRENKIGRGGVYSTSVFDPGKPPPRVDIHCDQNKPSSWRHFVDWFNSWF